MSDLRHSAETYLALRRGLGFKLRQHGPMLADFVAYLERAGASTVTTKHALAWAIQPQDVQPYRWGQRLCVVRGFARYLAAFDPAAEVPPQDLLSQSHHRPVPFIYTEAEIAVLLNATDELRPALRAATHRCLFGLLAATGMRISEAIALNRDDVDQDAGVLVIRQTKFNKSRQLPLHRSVVDELRRYAARRDEFCPRPRVPSFFVSTAGSRLIDTCVRHVFVRLVAHVGLLPRFGSGRPRVHDLRHHFAVACLLDWYRAGEDVAARVPLLSAYLGHAGLASTYWYLQATPELLALAAQRLGRNGELR